MRRVAELVGVSESFLSKAVRNNVPARTLQQMAAIHIHKRFYTALILHDLVNEMSLPEVAHKYNQNKGMLQGLQQSAATFSGGFYKANCMHTQYVFIKLVYILCSYRK